MEDLSTAIAISYFCFNVIVIIFAIITKLGQVNSRTPTTREQRINALRQHVANAGARDVFVKRVGPVGTYLEHFMLHYYDAENSWQVRHIIRNQIKDRYYWDNPVVMYEREISAEISQAKQELINDLDLEIHQLRQAIALATTKNEV